MAPRKVSKGKKPTETMRQRQQRLLREQKARKAAASKPVRSTRGSAVSQRVEKVKVKVEPQKKLPAAKAQKALPPGKKGGAVSTGNRPRRTNINSNPPKGTQMGTRGGGVKPQPRLGPATIRSAGATSKALSATGRVAGRIALPLAAYAEGKGLYDSLKRGEGYARLPGMIGRALKGNGQNKRSTGGKTNRRGRPVGTVPDSKTKPAGKVPAKRGVSNIPPSEGARNNPNYGKPGNPNSANKSAPKPKPTPTNTPKPTPTNTPKPTSTTSTKPTTTRTPQKKGEGGMDANYKAWAKANPTLAKKVKKGKSGYKAINGTSKPPAGTGNHRGAGNGAPGAQTQKKTAPIKIKDGNNAKGRTKRLGSALENLKVRKYK